MTEHVLKILRYEHWKILEVCFMRATRGGLGSRPPLAFFENRKKYPDLGKKALIVSIFGLNIPFKM